MSHNEFIGDPETALAAAKRATLVRASEGEGVPFRRIRIGGRSSESEELGYFCSMPICFSLTIALLPCGGNLLSRFTFQQQQLALALAPQHPQLTLLLSSFGNSGSLFRSCVSAARLSPAHLFCLLSSFTFLFRSRVPFLFHSRMRCQCSHMMAGQFSV